MSTRTIEPGRRVPRERAGWVHGTLAVCTWGAAAILMGCSGESGITAGGTELPTGEQWTYLNEASGSRITKWVEPVSERIDGYDVVRVTGNASPPGLGLYVAYDPGSGLVNVATDSWSITDPTDTSRESWRPPVFTCRFGDAPGTTCDWQGTHNGRMQRNVTIVDSYVPVDVPYGHFSSVMLMRETNYDEVGDVRFDNWLWIDHEIGTVLIEDTRDGSRLVLTDYTPPAGGVGIHAFSAR